MLEQRVVLITPFTKLGLLVVNWELVVLFQEVEDEVKDPK